MSAQYLLSRKELFNSYAYAVPIMVQAESEVYVHEEASYGHRLSIGKDGPMNLYRFTKDLNGSYLIVSGRPSHLRDFIEYNATTMFMHTDELLILEHTHKKRDYSWSAGYQDGSQTMRISDLPVFEQPEDQPKLLEAIAAMTRWRLEVQQVPAYQVEVTCTVTRFCMGSEEKEQESILVFIHLQAFDEDLISIELRAEQVALEYHFRAIRYAHHTDCRSQETGESDECDCGSEVLITSRTVNVPGEAIVVPVPCPHPTKREQIELCKALQQQADLAGIAVRYCIKDLYDGTYPNVQIPSLNVTADLNGTIDFHGQMQLMDEQSRVLKAIEEFWSSLSYPLAISLEREKWPGKAVEAALEQHLPRIQEAYLVIHQHFLGRIEEETK